MADKSTLYIKIESKEKKRKIKEKELQEKETNSWPFHENVGNIYLDGPFAAMVESQRAIMAPVID